MRPETEWKHVHPCMQPPAPASTVPIIPFLLNLSLNVWFPNLLTLGQQQHPAVDQRTLWVIFERALISELWLPMTHNSPTPSLAAGRCPTKGGRALLSQPWWQWTQHSTARRAHEMNKLCTNQTDASPRLRPKPTSQLLYVPNTLRASWSYPRVNPAQTAGVTGVTPACESTVHTDSETPPNSSFSVSRALYMQASCLSSSAPYKCGSLPRAAAALLWIWITLSTN